MTEAKMSLTEQLAAQAQGRFFGPQAPEAYDKPTNIVVAGNGIFRVVKTPVALFKAKISDIPAGSKIPGLGNMEEGPELLIPKIPLKYLIMILTFYRDVHTKDKTEASALFFWNHDSVALPSEYTDKTPVNGLLEDGQLVVYCPQQKNSGTLSEFHEDGMVTYLRDNCTPLCETHSHHTMDAFWSGTDNANENATQFYGVWGKINDTEPKFLFRWVCGDKKINIDPSVLFDIPQVEIKTTVTRTIPVDGFEPVVAEDVKYEAFKGPWQRVEAPEDWMAQHRKAYYATTPYNYNRGGTGAAGTPSAGGRPLYNYADERYPYNGESAYYGEGSHGNGATGGGGRHQNKNDFKSDFETKVSETVKKNWAKTSPEAETEVKIFLEKTLGDDKSIGEAEDTVRHLINEMIELGYDYVISDIVNEEEGYNPYTHGGILY